MHPLSPVSSSAGWRLDHSYAGLPELFHREVLPEAVPAPGWAVFNRPLAARLGLDADELGQEKNAELFAGNRLPEGARPLAQAYAGHQFGNFTALGDGRALLLGEQLTPDGKRFDIQLKGSGPTPYSRRGDGRAALGPMLREYIISEAMQALHIPTTRSLAVVTTGALVLRREKLPGAVLTRVASSHIRVGTFEWAAAHGDLEALRALMEYTIGRHYPEVAGAGNAALALLRAVIDRHAELVARWHQVGFIHGVLNTDNVALSGETIDYGPCAFMDTYDPATVFSSIDHGGRYAFGNQPLVTQWNLARLAESLLPLIHDQEEQAMELAHAAIQSFPGIFNHYNLSGMRRKLGLFNEEEEDAALVTSFLEGLHRAKADYTNSFRALGSGNPAPPGQWEEAGFQEWQKQWSQRVARQPQSLEEARNLMDSHNPAVIPRNHRVEEALAAAENDQDYSVMHRLLGVLHEPFAISEADSEYTQPPDPGSCRYQTFCGT